MLAPLSALLLAAHAGPSPSAQAEVAVDAPYVTLDLFKNGEVIVRRVVHVDGDGRYVLHEDLSPRHGTLRVESPATVELLRTTRTLPAGMPVPDHEAALDLRAILVDSPVVVHMKGETSPVEGVLRSAPSSILGNAHVDPMARYAYNSVGSYVVMETPIGVLLIAPGEIESIEARGSTVTRRTEAPAVVLDVSDTDNQPAEIRLSYASDGAAWAPSYIARLNADGTMRFERGATIRNELADFANCEVRLVTGTPVFEFRGVDSPFGGATKLDDFFRQLLRAEDMDDRWYWGWWRGEGVRRQSSLVGQYASAPSRHPEDSAAPFLGPTTEDLELHSIGRRSLRKGDSMHTVLGREVTDYGQTIEIEVEARDRSYWVRQSTDNEGEAPSAYNVLRFDNPFDVALSTGSLLVEDESGAVCQVRLPWTAAGGTVEVRTSRALSIEVLRHERLVDRPAVPVEDSGEESGRQASRGGSLGRLVHGTLTVTNRRDEAVHGDLRLYFDGKIDIPVARLFEVEGSAPRIEHRGLERPYGNRDRTLVWDVDLEPREVATFDYFFDVE